MDIKNHLLDRWCRFGLYEGLTFDSETATFPLWNVSGQMVGFHQYRPQADKTAKNHPREGRYYTRRNEHTIAVFGVETLNWPGPLFVVEGLFNATRLHWHGFAAIAVLSNDPKGLGAWLKTLNKDTIALLDGDNAGKKLAKYCNRAIQLPDGEDVGSLPSDQFLNLLDNFR